MPIEIEQDGQTVQAFTQAELDAHATAAVEAVKADTTKTVAEKDAEITRLSKLNIDKTENFKKYNEMSAEEKAAYDANTTELLKRNQIVETELGEVKTKLEEKETRERTSAKDGALKVFHEGNAEIKTTLEEKYALLAAMPETTPEEITARAIEAAKLAGISIDSRQPLFSHMNGDAPNYKPNKDYADTPQGKEAADLVRAAMSIPAPKA